MKSKAILHTVGIVSLIVAGWYGVDRIQFIPWPEATVEKLADATTRQCAMEAGLTEEMSGMCQPVTWCYADQLSRRMSLDDYVALEISHRHNVTIQDQWIKKMANSMAMCLTADLTDH